MVRLQDPLAHLGTVTMRLHLIGMCVRRWEFVFKMEVKSAMQPQTLPSTAAQG